MNPGRDRKGPGDKNKTPNMEKRRMESQGTAAEVALSYEVGGWMKAIRIHKRGGPGALVYEEAPVPTVGSGEVLVKVHAAGITPTEFTWNSTFTTSDKRDRLPVIPSFEVSGTVERRAPDVSDLAIGDAVYGLLNFWRDGAAAEYVTVRSSDLAPKPESLDHVHAAAVPLSGLTAWQALFDHAKTSKGQRVLVHGAGGGVGSFAVQFAHWKGAYVIGTASRSKAAFLQELGADEVIDYAAVRFEEKVRDVDVVVDTVGGETLERSWGVLRRGGFLVTIVGDTPEEKTQRYGVRGASILVQPDRSELTEISRLIDAGKVHAVIEAVFPLSDARLAYEHGLQGHNQGKLVLKVAD
jgi:NADPH:quinone reductase-like Zn-dependent oxidoreductase